MSEKQKDLLAAVFFAALALLFFNKFLDGNYVLAFRDLSAYFYPLRYIMAEMVKGGQLPLWNPYIFCGNPLMATLQVGFFYPLSVMHYLFPFDLAFNYYTILHYFLGSLFFYFLARHYNLSRSAGVMGGVVFAYSGYLLSVANLSTSLSSVIWLPLAVLFYDRVLKEFNILNLTAAAFFLVLMFLGGEPTIIYSTLIVLLFYGIFFTVYSKVKTVLIFFLSAALAAALSAIQLFPFIELLTLSSRTAYAGFTEISSRSYPIRETINMILPFFFGNNSVIGSYSPVFLGNIMQDWLISQYLGFIPLFFIALALFNRCRLSVFWALAGVMGLVLSFGKYTPAYYLFYKYLPGFSFIRYPVKYFFLFSFSAAILSAIGADLFLKSKKRPGWTPIFLGIASLILIAAHFLAKHFQNTIGEYLLTLINCKLSRHQLDCFINNLSFSINDLLFLGCEMAVFALLLYGIAKKKLDYRNVLFIAVLIVAVDYFSVNSGINIPYDNKLMKKAASNIEFVKNDREQFRYFLTAGMGNHNRCVYGDRFEQGIVEAKDKFAANRLLPDHLSDFHGYESVKIKAAGDFHNKVDRMPYGEKIKLLGWLNVKYIVSQKPVETAGLQLVRHSDQYVFGECYLYRNAFCRPRAYLVKDLSSLRLAAGKAEIAEYKANSVKIKTSVKEMGYLFLGDSYYPGWRVLIDGREKELIKAYYNFRAVAVEPGEHLVEFQFRPFSFRLGGAASIAAVLILAWGINVKRTKK